MQQIQDKQAAYCTVKMEQQQQQKTSLHYRTKIQLRKRFHFGIRC